MQLSVASRHSTGKRQPSSPKKMAQARLACAATAGHRPPISSLIWGPERTSQAAGRGGSVVLTGCGV